MASPEIVPCPDKASLAQTALNHILNIAGLSIKDQSYFSLALSGGSTPALLYQLISHLNPSQTDFSNWRFYFSDERILPHSHPDSNYYLAQQNLFQPLLDTGLISPNQIYPVDTSLPDPAQIAALYQHQIISSFAPNPPHFDLVLLGLGSDGHTASLFPGKPSLESDLLVTDSSPGVLPPPVNRITFTFPLINQAKNVYFLVSGLDKAETLNQVLSGADLPASRVKPSPPALFFADQDALSLLPPASALKS